jgi:hypothetical protein
MDNQALGHRPVLRSAPLRIKGASRYAAKQHFRILDVALPRIFLKMLKNVEEGLFCIFTRIASEIFDA